MCDDEVDPKIACEGTGIEESQDFGKCVILCRSLCGIRGSVSQGGALNAKKE